MHTDPTDPTDPTETQRLCERLSDRLSDRLTELEIKASFAEDTLDRLNDVIVRQQAQIDSLIRELMQLRQQPTAAEASPARSLRDELPPHY